MRMEIICQANLPKKGQNDAKGGLRFLFPRSRNTISKKFAPVGASRPGGPFSAAAPDGRKEYDA